MKLKTVKIARKEHPLGYIVINESDMADKDVLYKETPTKTRRPTRKAVSKK